MLIFSFSNETQEIMNISGQSISLEEFTNTLMKTIKIKNSQKNILMSM